MKNKKNHVMAFCMIISSSINLIFLKSVLRHTIYNSLNCCTFFSNIGLLWKARHQAGSFKIEDHTGFFHNIHIKSFVFFFLATLYFFFEMPKNNVKSEIFRETKAMNFGRKKELFLWPWCTTIGGWWEHNKLKIEKNSAMNIE